MKVRLYIVLTFLLGLSVNVQTQDITAADLIDLPLETLMQMEAIVETASKQDERLIDTAAAAFVITDEDIKKHGVRSISEALRLAPGLQVARIGSSSWAIASRGLNGLFSQYLLVLIDGRSIFTSLFSGVNWDEQNLMLEDIEKIEVIRGPGGSVWGANAVNGVINIITKAASDTKGVEVFAGVGTDVVESYFAGRVSGKLANGNFRLAYNQSENGALEGRNLDIEDQPWDSRRLSFYFDKGSDKSGFQLDSALSEVITNSLWPVITPQAPLVSFSAPEEKKRHYYLQGNYHRHLNETLQIRNRFSLDDTRRESALFDWNTKNIDLDVEFLFSPFDRYSINFGINTRFIESELVNNGDYFVTLTPEKQKTERYSAFVQNKLIVNPKLEILLGARLDRDSNFDPAFQPSLRFIYKPNAHHRVWGAVSQASSAPSRIVASNSVARFIALPGSEITGFLPTIISAVPFDENLESAELTAYELGYRYIISNKMELDISIFQHEYENLLDNSEPLEPFVNSSETTPFIDTRFTFDSIREDTISGLELAFNWQINRKWQLQYSGTYTDDSFDQRGDEQIGGGISRTSPRWQHSLRTNWTISKNISLFTWYKYVAEYESTQVDSYESLNVNLIYLINHYCSISLSGKNLIDEDHLEFQQEAARVEDFEIPSYWFIKLDWKIN